MLPTFFPLSTASAVDRQITNCRQCIPYRPSPESNLKVHYHCIPWIYNWFRAFKFVSLLSEIFECAQQRTFLLLPASRSTPQHSLKNTSFSSFFRRIYSESALTPTYGVQYHQRPGSPFVESTYLYACLRSQQPVQNFYWPLIQHVFVRVYQLSLKQSSKRHQLHAEPVIQL